MFHRFFFEVHTPTEIFSICGMQSSFRLEERNTWSPIFGGFCFELNHLCTICTFSSHAKHLEVKKVITINQSYSFLSGMKPVQRKLKPKAIPHIFKWTKPKSASATDREARHAAKEKNVATEIPCDDMNIAQEIDVTTSDVTSSTELENLECVTWPPYRTQATQACSRTLTQGTQTRTVPKFSIDDLWMMKKAYTTIQDLETTEISWDFCNVSDQLPITCITSVVYSHLYQCQINSS